MVIKFTKDQKEKLLELETAYVDAKINVVAAKNHGNYPGQIHFQQEADTAFRAGNSLIKEVCGINNPDFDAKSEQGKLALAAYSKHIKAFEKAGLDATSIVKSDPHTHGNIYAKSTDFGNKR